MAHKVALTKRDMMRFYLPSLCILRVKVNIKCLFQKFFFLDIYENIQYAQNSQSFFIESSGFRILYTLLKKLTALESSVHDLSFWQSML